MKNFLLIIAVFFIGFTSCTNDDTEEKPKDSFDRKSMLSNMANSIIIPSYTNFYATITALNAATSNFVKNTNAENLKNIRDAWQKSYISWQSVSMYQIGKAEEISFGNFMNIYPVNAENIAKNITKATYNLKAVSQQDEQGFGALDFLLNGLANNDTEILGLYTDQTNGDLYKKYLTDIVSRMDVMTLQVLDDWKGAYKDEFMNSSGSSATSSLDKLMNDFVYHYEKNLRAGKIGIPAGVFSKDPLATKVEAYYKGDISKKLFLANLQAVQDFFNGKSVSGSSNGEFGISSYLNFLNTIKEGEDLSTLINNQFDTVKNIASGLNDNFADQIVADNNAMLKVYDQLQKNTVLLKVDMLQAMSISVDYVDADGD